LNESDFVKLPTATRRFVLRLVDLGLDRTRIYGLFVMLGLYVGSPNTQEEIEALFSKLQLHLPIDRSKNLDEEIGHLYDGYDREINEFCFRSGVEFKFREINVPNVEKTFYIVYLQDEGLLNPNIKSVETLADSTRLFDSFIFSLGRSSVTREASLLEAFSCGVFQIQLHAQIDIQGSMQIAAAIKSLMSPFFFNCFNTLMSPDLDYFLGLEAEQIALLNLMHPMDQSYAEQMWGFQSYLFFNQGSVIEGVEDLHPRQWFDWVLDRAKYFDTSYPSNLLPFSKSNITLTGIPIWNKDISKFEICDTYIQNLWGFSADYLNGPIETLEYKALIVHLVYSSLTSSREAILH
jgi:hypothetical protein